jgi:anti-sigma-K factor RskA
MTSSQLTFWQKLGFLLRSRLPALGLALIVVMALGNLLLLRQLNLASQHAITPMRVIALANTQNSPGAVGTMIADQKGNYGTLVVDNLPALDSNHQYQVWLTQSGKRVSGGVFSVNIDGYASLEIMAAMPLIQYDSIGITIEPYGGSPGPTGAKVLGGDIIQ